MDQRAFERKMAGTRRHSDAPMREGGGRSMRGFPAESGNADPLRVLLIEDDQCDARIIREMLCNAGDPFEVLHREHLAAGLSALAGGGIAVVLLDSCLPDCCGAEGVARLRDAAPDVPVLILSADDDGGMAIAGLQSGAQDYLVKGRIDADLLSRSIRYAVERTKAAVRLRRQEEEYRLLFEQMPERCYLFEILRDEQGDPADYRCLDLNLRAEEALGCSRDASVGKTITGVFGAIEEDWRTLLDTVARSGAGRHAELHSPLAGLPQYASVYRPEYDRLAVIVYDISGQIDAEEALIRRTWALENRVRELGTLYRISRLIGTAAVTPEDIVRGAVDLLPGGFQYPDITGVRVAAGGIVHATEGFPEMCPGIRAEIRFAGIPEGWIEIRYRDAPAKGDPFLMEERDLVHAVAGMIGRALARIRIEDALRQSEERYRSLFNAMHEGFALCEIICDDTGKPCDYCFLDVNPAFERLIGLARDSVLGQRVHDALPEIDPVLIEIGGRVALTGEPAQYEHYNPVLRRWHEGFAYSPARGQFATLFVDITERREAEDALSESEAKYREVVEGANIIILRSDGSGIITFCNEYATRFFGYREDELVGRSALGTIIPDIETSGRDLEAMLVDIIAQPERYIDNVHENIRKNGERVWIRWRNRPIYDGHGRMKELLSVGIDITEQIKAEEALRESEEKFRAITQRSFDMIFTSDRQGIITYISPAVERLLGYAPAEIVGGSCRDYVLPSSIHAFASASRELLRGDDVEGLQVELIKKDGSSAVIEINASPILRSDAVAGIQCTGRDITERVLMENLKQQAYDQIERNIEQFAVLGDHIRHPLQVIMGWADVAADEYSEKIHEQVRRINEIIRQLDQGWVESRKIREFLRRNE
ncbi:sensory box histidine kinase/response regulator [hydrocarbon metagenome]|uniref:Sensory box histidine kinase/response regulator n=1 Tax=hydrocarbon metagenome TaxID=938273 RepID=A0A0W8FG86_9ZZZZ|nr:PAS domain S-box protein [Methanomicrobiaceae archaeon]